MAWGMNKDMTPENKTIPEIWYDFLKISIEGDDAFEYFHGWHWFWCLYFLHKELPTFPNFQIVSIKKILPKKHWLQKIDDSYSDGAPNFELDERYKLLKETSVFPAFLKAIKAIKNPEAINKIDFSQIIFNKLILDKPVNFSNFIFPINASFEHAEFSHDIHFTNAIFLKDAVFNDAKFLKDVVFNDAKFLKDAVFNDAKFLTDADFKNTEILTDANFKNTEILTEVRFDNVVFFDTADFEGAEFHTETSSHLESARFRNTTFKKIANFRNAIFWRYANFKGATFSGRTTFQKADFKCNAPRFYYATFNYEMTFLSMIPPKFRRAPDEKPMLIKAVWNFITEQKLTLINTIWLTTTEKKLVIIKNALDIRQKKKAKYKQRIQENQNSYENTSILLEKQGKYHDKHFFFRQEMRCRRRLEGFFNLTTYGIYELLANYGYGVGRALLGWLAHICFWAWMLSVFVFYKTPSPDKLYCSFLTSLSNAHSFFLSKGERLSSCNIEDTAPKDIMRAFDFIWAIETMFGAFFLFLLILTLRVRFRLGGTAINPTINATITPTPKKK